MYSENEKTNGKTIDVEKELARISKHLESLESYNLWNAFVYYLSVDKCLDDETYVRFCQNAYMALKGHDDLYLIDDEHTFENNIFFLEKIYVRLLDTYGFSAKIKDELIDEMLFRYYTGWSAVLESIAEQQGYNEDNDVEIDDDDEWISELAAILTIPRLNKERKKLLCEYGIQDEPMHAKAVYWFSSQIIVDFAVRPFPNESGKKAYQDIVDLNLLIWMAVALGEDASVIHTAVSAANAEKGLLKKCDAFRKLIPFARFCELSSALGDEYVAAHPEAADDLDEE